MNYRPSKSFLLAMSCLCPLVIALGFGLLPELEAMKKPPVRGQISFRTERPDSITMANSVSPSQGSVSRWSLDWFEETYENLMSWDKNPWKTRIQGCGEHYFELLESTDPVDIARAKELRRLADALHKKLLERYPELAVAAKNVPPERNGFLEWLEFSERFSQPKGLDFPEDLKKHLSGEVPWDAAAAKAWLSRNKPLMDEIRAIGLMPEQSISGIDVHRFDFIPARLAKECADALLPMLSDTADPKYPPDPEALLDFFSGGFLDVVMEHEGRPLTDLPSIQVSSVFPDNSQLSRQSRQLTEMLFVGARAWRKGWDRAQSVSAMTQAALAIMNGQPVPNDPIYGQSYVWDPATRKLSPPDHEVFQDLDLKPITVPKH